jgi:hypothetical protein
MNFRIANLRWWEASDPEIAGGSGSWRRYMPLRHTQLLGIFRTRYDISCSLLGQTRSRTLLIEAKREAFHRHTLEIEKFLREGRGGEFIKKVETEIACECDCGHEHTRTIETEMPYRLPYSYHQLLEAGAEYNEEVILLGLRSRTLSHRKYWASPDAEARSHEWCSEVALGLAKNHPPIDIRPAVHNPFYIEGWCRS